MNFGEVVAEVIRITKRQDKAADVKREVNQAMAHFSSDANFVRDLKELNLAIDANQYTQSLALSSLPRYRKMWYVKLGGTRIPLRRMDTKNLFDKSCDTRNRYYVVGDSINISLATLASSLDIGYVQVPPWITTLTDTYWMLEVMPGAIIDRAAAKIFTSISDMPSASRHEAFAISQFQSFRMGSDMIPDHAE